VAGVVDQYQRGKTVPGQPGTTLKDANWCPYRAKTINKAAQSAGRDRLRRPMYFALLIIFCQCVVANRQLCMSI
jgi:hypothetical protein